MLFTNTFLILVVLMQETSLSLAAAGVCVVVA